MGLFDNKYMRQFKLIRGSWTTSARFNKISRINLKILNRVTEPTKPVLTERRLKSRNTEYNFKWNQLFCRVSNLLLKLLKFCLSGPRLKVRLPTWSKWTSILKITMHKFNVLVFLVENCKFSIAGSSWVFMLNKERD